MEDEKRTEHLFPVSPPPRRKRMESIRMAGSDWDSGSKNPCSSTMTSTTFTSTSSSPARSGILIPMGMIADHLHGYARIHTTHQSRGIEDTFYVAGFRAFWGG